MGVQFQKNLPVSQMNISHIDIYTFYTYADGGNVYVATLGWDGTQRQMYIYQKESSIGTVCLSFDGSVNNIHLNEDIRYLDYNSPIPFEIGFDNRIYFTNDGKMNIDYAVMQNNSALRLNNCTLLIDVHPTVGLAFDMCCQFMGDYYAKKGGVFISGVYDHLLFQ